MEISNLKGFYLCMALHWPVMHVFSVSFEHRNPSATLHTTTNIQLHESLMVA